jgi:glycosyltransferase involved in cell wall biosynthesis
MLEPKNILFLTTMYPDPLRPGTPVCHYYTKEWVKQGHKVEVITLRSMFPPIYTFMAGLFPKLAHRYVGNHVEMDRNMNIIHHEKDGVFVHSIPIFKYIPHGKYPKKSINKTLDAILKIITEKGFVPDAIMGHFYNPSMELIIRLKEYYPNAKTSLVFHDSLTGVIKKNYPDVKNLLQKFDLVGGRHKSMTIVLNQEFGPFKHPYVCVSGTPDSFINNDSLNKVLTDGPIRNFLYVGQFTTNKCVQQTVEAIFKIYKSEEWHISLVGDGGTCMGKVKEFVSNNKLEQHVSFEGRIPRERIKEYYDKSECYVMISRSEAFGLVYLEAMSRGCICIGTKGQGIDGVIRDGFNGFLCDGGSVEGLKEVLLRINSLSAEEKTVISKNAINTAKLLSDSYVAQEYIASLFEPGLHELVKLS